VEARRDLRSETTWDPILQELEDATSGPEVPTPKRLQDLTERAENFQPSEQVKENGKKDDEDEEVGSTFDNFFNTFDFGDDEEMKKRLKELTDRLDQEAEGRIVVIREND
jgi:hypothetical protein